MATVSADMLISEVLSSCPGAAAVFERHGLSCGACLAASMETLTAVASVHEVSVEALLADLRGLTGEECSPREES